MPSYPELYASATGLVTVEGSSFSCWSQEHLGSAMALETPQRKCAEASQSRERLVGVEDACAGMSLRKCRTNVELPSVNDLNSEESNCQGTVAHVGARPDVSLLKRRESERSLRVSPLTQLFRDSNQRKAGSRILVNITIRRSPGPLRVIVDADADVKQVIQQALTVYAREGRLPVLQSGSDAFELYCGQDMCQAVAIDQRIGSLGVRHFLMCPRTIAASSACNTSANEQPGDWNTWWKKMLAWQIVW